jgi:hypothetical protein
MAMDIEEDPEIALSVPVEQFSENFNDISKFFNFSCWSQSQMTFFTFYNITFGYFSI